MTQERMYYGVYAVIDPEHEQKLTELIAEHKGKKFGQKKRILGIFGKAHYAAQTALLFLQDCLKEPSCTYSILILRGPQSSLVTDAKDLIRELSPGCCMITEDVLEKLQDQHPQTQEWGPATTASGARIMLHTLHAYGDLVLEDEAASSLFDFSGVDAPKEKSEEHAPQEASVANSMALNENEEEQLETDQAQDSSPIELSSDDDQDMLEVAAENQIYSPPTAAQASSDHDDDLNEEDPEATEPPFSPDTLPNLKDQAQPAVGDDPVASEATSELHPSPTLTRGYTMPKIQDPWYVQWRQNSVLFWSSLCSIFCITMMAIWVFWPAEPEPMEPMTIEEEEQSLFDDAPVKTVEKKAPAYRTILTVKEAKEKVLDLEKTTFPQSPGPKTAFLEIISNPPGATVKINGKKISDSTPLTTFLVHADQKMHLEVNKPGHVGATRDISIPIHQRRGLLFILNKE